MPWRADVPYNELPWLPPRADLETAAILRGLPDARAAVAALDMATRLMPDPQVLVNTIPVLEAKACLLYTSDAADEHRDVWVWGGGGG